MTKRKIALLILVLAISIAPCFGATEILSGHFSGINAWNSSTNSGFAGLQACDQGNPTVAVTVRLDVVNEANTKSGSTTVTNLKCTGGTSIGQPDLSGTFGTAVMSDGDQYYWTGTVVSNQNPGTGDRLMLGAGWPSNAIATRYPYKFTGGAVAPPWTAPTLTPGNIRLSAANMGIIYITTDTYGTGTVSGGTLVCVPSNCGANLYNNGAAGYYAQKWSVPLNNTHMCGVNISTAGNISYTLMSPVLACLATFAAAGVQHIGLAFSHPFLVNGPNYNMSMTGYVTVSGNFPTALFGTNQFCPNPTDVLAYQLANPFFRNVTATPYTDTGYFPTVMLVGQSGCNSDGTGTNGGCSNSFANFKTMVDAAFAAKDSNPTTGSVYSPYSSNPTGNQGARILPTTVTLPGTATYVRLGTFASPYSSTALSSTNILMYIGTGPNTGSSTSETWVPGSGIWSSVTSTEGQFGNSVQTSVGYYLARGAAMSYGGVIEPCGSLPLKFPDPILTYGLAQQGTTLGMSVLASVPTFPGQANLAGDPLAAPFTATPPSPAPVSSNVRFDGIGDSSARVIFNVSVTFNGVRLRYDTSSCTSGTGGTVQGNTTQDGFQLYDMTAIIAGLAPSTLMHVCPEVTNDAGATWSSGVEGTFTTLARTQTLPTAPTAVSTTYPAQSGGTLAVLSDCSNFQSQVDAATPGDTITVPIAAPCTTPIITPRAPDSKSFTPSNVVTSTSTIAVTAHGLSENQEVHFSTAGVGSNCLPGMLIIPAQSNLQGFDCDKGGGWNKASKYYVHVVDVDHVKVLTSVSGPAAIPGWITATADATADTITFLPTWATLGGYAYVSQGTPIPANTQVQFVSSNTLPGGITADTTYFLLTGCASSSNISCVTQISLSSGGSPVNITSAGTGTLTIVDRGLGTMYIAPAPSQSGPWIVIKTTGTVPVDRPTSANDGQFFHLTKTTYDATPMFSTGILAHNWRIIGAVFDTGTNTDYLTTTDPRPFCVGPTTFQDSRYIVMDHIRIQGPGYPNRTGCRSGAANMFWDGGYNAIINSDLRHLDFWHPWYGLAGTGSSNGPGLGLVPTKASTTQVTATPGVCRINAGIITTFTGTTTINLTSGSSSDTAYVYCGMDGTLNVVVPSGMAGNCSTVGTSCTVIVSGSSTPTWPVDGNSRRAGLALFTIKLASGLVSSVSQSDATSAPGLPFASEGTNAIIAGNGPGPYLFSNNYVSGAGLTLHFDESAGPLIARGDYTVTNNEFDIPAVTMLGGPASDGLWYGNRQPIEAKAGQRILISKNTITGCFIQVNPIGTCIILTPRSGGYTTDVEISNNNFGTELAPVSGAAMIASPFHQHAPVSKPAVRQLVKNNVAFINGWTQSAPQTQPQGFVFYGGEGQEDVSFDHNTIYDNRGQGPAFLVWLTTPAGGMSFTNNVYFYVADYPMMGNAGVLLNPACSGMDQALMNCAFTSGPGNPSYTFTGNVVVPSWSSSQAASGVVSHATIDAAFGTLFSGGSNFMPPDQGSQPANLAYVGFIPVIKTLNLFSPYLGAGYAPLSFKPTRSVCARGLSLLCH